MTANKKTSTGKGNKVTGDKVFNRAMPPRPAPLKLITKPTTTSTDTDSKSEK